MKMTIYLTCFCFIAHGALLFLAICRSAKLADDAMREAFRARKGREAA